MKLKEIVDIVKDDQKPTFVRRQWQLEKKLRAKQSKTNSPKVMTDKEHDLFPYKFSF